MPVLSSTDEQGLDRKRKLMIKKERKSECHLCAVIGCMADSAHVAGCQLGHADELHVVLHSIVGGKQVPVGGSMPHCGLTEGIQGSKEGTHDLHSQR